jgi:hypothetical protein
MHPDHKDTGFYAIPGAYLGYKSGSGPNIYLHRLVVPAEILFNKTSLSDPDTLTWEEAMKESPENVTKWVIAADLEIKALKEKEIWQEVPPPLSLPPSNLLRTNYPLVCIRIVRKFSLMYRRQETAPQLFCCPSSRN